MEFYTPDSFYSLKEKRLMHEIEFTQEELHDMDGMLNLRLLQARQDKSRMTRQQKDACESVRKKVEEALFGFIFDR